jgi:predicted enzyme related to lactoylglutathione lyase
MSAVMTAELIGSLEYVSVLVKDQDSALAFYRDVLGFEVSDDETYGTGQRWLSVRPAGSATRIVLFADPHAAEEEGCCGSGGCGSCGPSYTWTGMVLGTSDVRGACESLAGRGVKILQEPQEKPWGVIDALFADSDGNVFNLVQRQR